jgi:hypothetical protein
MLEDLRYGNDLPPKGSNFDFGCETLQPDVGAFSSAFQAWTLAEVGGNQQPWVTRFKSVYALVPVTRASNTYYMAPANFQWFAFCQSYDGMPETPHYGWRASFDSPVGANLLGSDDGHFEGTSLWFRWGGYLFIANKHPRRLYLTFRLHPDTPQEAEDHSNVLLGGRLGTYG